MILDRVLRDDRGAPRSLIAYYLLAVAAPVFACLAAVAPSVPALLVPAAVLAVAVGRLALGVALAQWRAICAALVAASGALSRPPRPRRHRPLGLADPCRRIEAVLLAGPRAPGVRAA